MDIRVIDPDKSFSHFPFTRHVTLYVLSTCVCVRSMNSLGSSEKVGVVTLVVYISDFSCSKEGSAGHLNDPD